MILDLIADSERNKMSFLESRRDQIIISLPVIADQHALLEQRRVRARIAELSAKTIAHVIDLRNQRCPWSIVCKNVLVREHTKLCTFRHLPGIRSRRLHSNRTAGRHIGSAFSGKFGRLRSVAGAVHVIVGQDIFGYSVSGHYYGLHV